MGSRIVLLGVGCSSRVEELASVVVEDKLMIGVLKIFALLVRSTSREDDGAPVDDSWTTLVEVIRSCIDTIKLVTGAEKGMVVKSARLVAGAGVLTASSTSSVVLADTDGSCAMEVITSWTVVVASNDALDVSSTGWDTANVEVAWFTIVVLKEASSCVLLSAAVIAGVGVGRRNKDDEGSAPVRNCDVDAASVVEDTAASTDIAILVVDTSKTAEVITLGTIGTELLNAEEELTPIPSTKEEVIMT